MGELTWDYRVMRSVAESGANPWPLYGIYEVYTEDRKLSWTDTPVYPIGETLKELENDIKRMKLALKKPILDHKTGRTIQEKQ